MITFKEYINEDLTRAEMVKTARSVSPDHAYGGHGQVVHKKTGMVTHIVDGAGKVTPVEPYEHDSRKYQEKNKNIGHKNYEVTDDEKKSIKVYTRGGNGDINHAVSHPHNMAIIKHSYDEKMKEHQKHLTDIDYHVTQGRKHQAEFARSKKEHNKTMMYDHLAKMKKAQENANKTKTELHREIYHHVKNLDSAMNKTKAPEKDRVYYRGLADHEVSTKELSKYKAGSKITTSQYLSTSSDPKVSHSYNQHQLIIHHPKHANAKVMSVNDDSEYGKEQDPDGKGEQEHLINRGSVMHVIRHEVRKNGHHRIHVRLE